MSVGGLHLLYSVEETASNIISGDSASFRPSSSAPEYSHPCLTKLTGIINCTKFMTEVTLRT